MIPIKIQCGCGQRYAFEVEAVDGRMPASVTCPVCGADGTEAANAVIAASLPAAPVRAAAPLVRLHAIAAPAVHLVATAPTMSLDEPPRAVSVAPSRSSGPRGPEVNRTQAEHEARAKVSWGDSQEEVIKFLMIQGLGYEEAVAMVQPMYKERAATIRANGIKKIFVGAALVCVPIVAFFIFMSAGYIPLKLFAITIAVGLWGAWIILKGIIMMLAPKSEPGDVAEQ